MAAHGITDLVINNEAVLRRLAAGLGPKDTKASLAAEFEREKSNFGKTLTRMQGEDLITDELALTDHGRAVLDALDRAAGEGGSTDAATQRAPHTAFKPDPNQPRKTFDPDELLDLARTIHTAGDILEPLVVRPVDASGARMIVAGERRWLATDLLAIGAVDGCTLPAALDPGQGGGIPFSERAWAEGEEPEIDTLILGLIENGARADLDPLEDGDAVLKVMTAKGWSARKAAFELGRVGKPDGQPGAGSKGIKTLQERVKVVREATPEDKARYRAGELTWKDLLASVQQEKPAPMAAPADAPPTGPDRVYHPLPVMHLVELPDPRPNWKGAPLAAIELARRPDGRWTYGFNCNDPLGGRSSGPGWTEGDDNIDDAFDTREAAFRDAMAAIRDWATDREYPIARKILRWLDGLAPDADPNDPCVYNGERWPNATMAGEARRRREGGGGASSPGRTKPAEPDAPAAPAQAAPLTIEEAIVLAELFYASRQPKAEGDHWHLDGHAPVGKYWLDEKVSSLKAADRITIVSRAGDGPRMALTSKGVLDLADVLKGIDLQASDWQTLVTVRRAFGARDPEGMGYRAAWLNRADVAEVQPEADQDDEEDARTVEDILGVALTEIAAERDTASASDFLAQLLTRTGVKGPFVVGAEMRDEDPATVYDAVGEAVLTIDATGDLPDAMAASRAIVVAACLNAAIGLTVDFGAPAPAAVTPTEDEAA